MEKLKLAGILLVVISQTQGASMNNPIMSLVGDFCPVNGAPCTVLSELGKECRKNRCSCASNYLEISFSGFLECVLKPGETCVENVIFFTSSLDRNALIHEIANYTQMNSTNNAIYESLDTFIQAFEIYQIDKTGKDLSCYSGKCDESTNRCTESVNPAFTLTEESDGSLWMFLGIGFGITLLVVGSVIHYSLRIFPF